MIWHDVIQSLIVILYIHSRPLNIRKYHTWCYNVRTFKSLSKITLEPNFLFFDIIVSFPMAYGGFISWDTYSEYHGVGTQCRNGSLPFLLNLKISLRVSFNGDLCLISIVVWTSYPMSCDWLPPSFRASFLLLFSFYLYFSWSFIEWFWSAVDLWDGPTPQAPSQFQEVISLDFSCIFFFSQSSWQRFW